MHRKFPSLEQFNKLYARETWEGLAERRKLVYGAKIKLHGTNMGIRIHPDGTVALQARASDIDAETDLTGFAGFFAPQKDIWSRVMLPDVVTFFGEWAGPGINKGDAVQRTDAKRFYIFAMGIGEAPHRQDDTILTPRLMITDPETIRNWLPAGVDTDRVRVLPWENEAPIVLDFADQAALDAEIEILNRSVDMVAERDPYISRTFGISHPGEGFVLVPIASVANPISCADYARTAFKAKTEKHRVQRQGKAATPSAPLPETVSDFVETFCTPQRVAQAIDEVCRGTPDVRLTGQVLSWVMADLEKEAADEIDALGVEPKRLKSEIFGAARSHFMAALADLEGRAA